MINMDRVKELEHGADDISPSEARSIAQKCIDLDRDFFSASIRIAALMGQLDDSESTVEELNEVIDLQEFENDKLLDAVKFAHKELKIDPHQVTAVVDKLHELLKEMHEL